MTKYFIERKSYEMQKNINAIKVSAIKLENNKNTLKLHCIVQSVQNV